MAIVIHTSAIVDHGAALGDGTRVWHFAHVCAGARIGARHGGALSHPQAAGVALEGGPAAC